MVHLKIAVSRLYQGGMRKMRRSAKRYRLTQQEEKVQAQGATGWDLLEEVRHLWSDEDSADEPEDPTHRHVEDWDRQRLDDLNFVL